MSAFIVSDKHISAMVSFASPYAHGEKYIAQVGQILLDQNYRSVTERYGESKKPHAFQLQECVVSAIQVIKLCDCYEYQACETENYKQTEAYKIVEEIRAVAWHSLPGYDEAEWTI